MHVRIRRLKKEEKSFIICDAEHEWTFNLEICVFVLHQFIEAHDIVLLQQKQTFFLPCVLQPAKVKQCQLSASPDSFQSSHARLAAGRSHRRAPVRKSSSCE